MTLRQLKLLSRYLYTIAMKIQNPAIPFGSTVVIIGANGYIGAETCDKFLEAGYRVRGTVRNVEEHRAWMHELFDKKYAGKFELVQVVDFEADGAFDEAFKGMKVVLVFIGVVNVLNRLIM